MAQLQTFEPFDCEGDPHSVGSRWVKWKRGLQIYLLAANIDSAVKKRATLLHTGGLALQEIYYNIPGADAEPLDNEGKEVNVYQVAIQKLDEYFAPKQSFVYERHLFRLLKQEEGEKFDKFLIKLRNQSSKCQFPDDNNLIDQITEKCRSVELRKKILMLGDTVTIEKIIFEANALEMVERQLQEYQRPAQNLGVNKIDVNKFDKINAECTRCGSKRHKADNTNCPAKEKICTKCGFKGHFLKQCRTRAQKRKKENIPKMPAKSDSDFKKLKTSTEIDYIFNIDADDTVNCQIGGVEVPLLIDSGSKCNILTDKTWNHLKTHAVQITNQQQSTDRVFMAYGSTNPLKVLGSFEANIIIGSVGHEATFYVIKDGTRDLLGKETAIKLKVLKMGVSVNSISEGPFPKFKDIKLKIAVNETVTPIIQPYRRIPIPLENKINSKIDELVAKDIIEPVDKPASWVSPIVPILKSNGEVRICVDMRCANKAIIRENHPLPTMAQLIPKFRKATLFSKLDIREAFHQVEISEDSRNITTFITGKGLFRYKRLMFGISCAPEHFQKILERMLLPCEGVINFIDDIIVFGSDEHEHNTRLQNVLEVLKQNNVLLNEEKCIYKTDRIEFIGHELTPGGIKPLDKYIKGIEDFREPKTIEEIQSFLGLINFIGKWIPNLATLTEPLRELLRLKLHKNTDITKYWKQEQNKSFLELKKSLGSIKTLGYFDICDQTQVIADASPFGLGAVLIQCDSKGPRVIAYGNKTLSDVEKRYCQTEKEALAIVWAVEHFRMYLYGLKEFDLITDHKPLEVIFGTRSKPCPRIERWVLRLQSYNYKIKYQSGKLNIADPFSRLCPQVNSNSFDEEFHINQIVQFARPVAVSFQAIKDASQIDSEFQMVKKGIMHGEWDNKVNHYKIFDTELWLHDEVLLRGNKLVIPLKLRQQVLEAAHEGHPGIVAMKGRLRTKVWWPRIDKDVETMVKSCKSCTLVSGPNPPMPMKRRILPSQAWVDVAADFLGPLPSGDYLFVVVDYYSRYKEIRPMKSITSQDTVDVLIEMFSRLGIPVSITVDNGRQFTSEVFKTFCHELNIHIFNTIPYWPQQNGEVERQNRDIVKRLKISQNLKSNWKKDLLYYLMMYNSTPHSTTGKSPSELFFNRTFRDKIPYLLDIEHMQTDLEVRDKDAEMKEKGKIEGDRKRNAQEDYLDVGEKVYVKNMIKENKLTSNFNPTPHTVTSANGSDINIRNDITGHEYKRNIVHLKRVEGEWRVLNKEGEDKSQDISSNTGTGSI